ncbi:MULTISPECIES: tape measure protein [unclassified Pseudomonas]|uniref:tape measure protein n=1 Tax=unclassified Pseudomonas TaxID=196821 RepID=UPI00244D7684|nr:MULTISPECIES: tape measure protein [unclassified Pseudomonas]MDH0894223.1 tape measure protein [Pseudomonas sp. GD03875]MDH1063482.1 tape measure protein [Pseudomonas sp. GD03985]
MAIKDRLIQFILRGRDEMSPEVKKATDAVEELSQEATRLGEALDSAKSAQGLGLALERVRRDVGLAQRSLDQAERQVVDLRDALSANPAAAGLQQSLRDAEREASRARRTLNTLEAQLTEAERAAHGAGIDVHNLSDEQRRLAAEVDRARTAVRDNNQVLQEARRDLAAASRAAAEHASRLAAVREGMARGARQVLGYAAAYVSLNAAFGLVQKGLNLVRDGINSMLGAGDQFELLDKRMASLMGSVAEGERATAWIKTFARDTPLELAEVSEAFALLKSYGLDPMDGSLQAVVDKNEQLGGGMERLQGIASALGQAYAKQKLQTEEVLQLVERGVPVWTMLEKITGKNAATLQELATKGRLGRDVIAALIKEMGQSAQGAAAEGMGTLTGLVSTLSDTWSDFLNRIAKSGALDYAKQQLKGVADYIDRMDKDGRLDKLATALSNAFKQGGEKAKEFAAELLKVDFEKLTDDTAKWLNSFGQKLDDAKLRLEAFWAPFRTMGNVITGGLSQVAASFIAGAAQIVSVAEELGRVLPDSMGGQRLVEKSQSAMAVLTGLYDAFSEQAKQDVADIGDAWDVMGEKVADSGDQQAKAAEDAAAATAASWDQAVNDALDKSEALRAETLRTTIEGQQAIASMASALDLINTAKTVQQLEGLRAALLAAYQSGKLSQEEYAQATGVLNSRMKELGGAAAGAANLVSDLEEKLGDLASVQAAISSAKTDVDINNIRAALRKLYSDGKIGSSEYNAELAKLNARQKELKSAVTDGAKAQKTKNEADKEAIVTSEQLRRESGKRMEAERQAGDEAMQRRRKESSDAKRDMGAMGEFFTGVLSRAREGAGNLSRAALEAFDALRGISTAAPSIDTSGLDATARSLAQVTQQLAEVRAALGQPMQSTLGRWMLETQAASLQTQQAFLGQKHSLQSLMGDYERGAISAQQFVSRAQGARRAMGLLDDADLSSLESAIAAANQRMQQMGESTRSTLEGLRDELDGLEGRTEDIERRRFAARMRDMQAQLVEAQAGGDEKAVANAKRAISLLREVEAATAQQRQREEQEKRMEASKQPAASGPAPRQQPDRIVRLESRGRAVEVAVQSDADETALLGILEDAAGRSL